MSRSDNPARALWDVRLVGPALMIVFGVVLLATPSASVGITGSVGNAGVLLKGDDEGGEGSVPPPLENPEPPSDPAPPVLLPEPEPTPAVPSPEPEPQPEPEAVPEPEQVADPSVVLGTGDEQAPVVHGDVLPRTGAGESSSALAAMGGAVLLVGGVALLVAGRRSASSQ